MAAIAKSTLLAVLTLSAGAAFGCGGSGSAPSSPGPEAGTDQGAGDDASSSEASAGEGSMSTPTGDAGSDAGATKDADAGPVNAADGGTSPGLDGAAPGIMFVCGGFDGGDDMGMPTCDSATEYCQILGAGEGFSYGCAPIPASCASSPTCACALADPNAYCPESDANNEGNMCSCVDEGGAITLTNQTDSA
jgi:hypothetical protein